MDLTPGVAETDSFLLNISFFFFLTNKSLILFRVAMFPE